MLGITCGVGAGGEGVGGGRGQGWQGAGGEGAGGEGAGGEGVGAGPITRTRQLRGAPVLPAAYPLPGTSSQQRQHYLNNVMAVVVVQPRRWDGAPDGLRGQEP